MERQTKIILLASGIVLLLSCIGVGVYFLVKNSEKSDDTTNKDGNSDSQGSQNDTNDTTGNDLVNTSEIKPVYNAENELDNSIGQLKGRVLFPKREWAGGWGYANVRSSPDVNTNQGWWDGLDNLVTTINEGTPIGEVLEDTRVDYNGYKYRWFKVKLIKPVGFWFPTKEGYVRADTVTIKPYTP